MSIFDDIPISMKELEAIINNKKEEIIMKNKAMNKYLVDVSREDWGRMEIQARNEEEASEKAYKQYYKDESCITWKGGSCEIVSVELVAQDGNRME